MRACVDPPPICRYGVLRYRSSDTRVSREIFSLYEGDSVWQIRLLVVYGNKCSNCRHLVTCRSIVQHFRRGNDLPYWNPPCQSNVVGKDNKWSLNFLSQLTPYHSGLQRRLEASDSAKTSQPPDPEPDMCFPPHGS